VYLQSEGGEPFDVLRDRNGVRMKFGNVHLQPDAIDRHSAALEIAHHGVNGIGLRIDGFGLSVVVEEKCLWIGFMRPAEALLDVSGTLPCKANSRLVVPDRTFHTSRAVFGERFVDDIPGEQFSAEVSGDGLDVRFEDEGQFVGTAAPFCQPWWKLVMPHQGVSAKLHSVLGGKTGRLVCLRKIKLILSWMHDLPLHRVFQFQQVEFTAESGGVRGFGKALWTNGCANENSGMRCCIA